MRNTDTVSYMTAPTTDDVMTLVSLRIPLDTLVWLDTHARDEKCSRSKLVREMLTSPRHIPDDHQ